MVVLTLSVSCYTISVRKVFLGPPIQDLASQPTLFHVYLNLAIGVASRGGQNYGNISPMESYMQEKGV